MLMFHDLPGVAVSCLLGPLLFVAPGFVAGQAANLVGFRQAGIGLRLLLSLPLSVAISPLLAFLLMRSGITGLVWGGFGVIWMAFLFCVIRDRKLIALGLAKVTWKPAVGWGLALMGFLSVMALSLVDLEMNDGLYPALSTHDTVKHVFVAEAISRTGVPPMNPAYSAGQPIPLYYYYHWFILPSLTDQLAGPYAGAREAVTACTIWTALSLMALIAVLLSIWDVRGLVPGRKSLAIGIALLGVMGFDLVPFLWSRAYGLPHPTPNVLYSLEWWADDQVTAWSNVMLWVPHHLGALVACFMGFLILDDLVRRGSSLAGCLCAGVAFASAVGQSIWVGATGAIILGTWFLHVALRGERRELVPHLLAALATLLFAAPFIYDLQRTGHSQGSPIIFHVRHLDLASAFVDHFAVTGVVPRTIIFVLLLPVFYFMELGFFAIAGLANWRHRRAQAEPLSRQERFFRWTAITAWFVCTFFRSAIVNNDFGWRATMFLQLPLLLWAVPVVQSLFGENHLNLTPRLRLWLIVSLLTGASGTLVELVMHRTHCEGERGDYATHLRDAYLWINANTPTDAVIQHNPDRAYEYMLGLYTYRQTAVVDRVYGGLFGVNPEMLSTVIEPCVAMFQKGSTASEVLATCQRFGITHLIIRVVDPIWRDETSWARKCPAVYDIDDVRVIRVADLAE
jgi:hypothetical protein